MDIKGITWVGNMYQKFENMWLEVEETLLEETVKYMEKTVGENAKKIYSDVMQDLVPPSSCDLGEKQVPELPMDQYTDADFCKKSFLGSKKVTVNADTKLTTKDSRTNNVVDIDVIHTESNDADDSIMSASGDPVKGKLFISHARRYVGSSGIRSNLDIDENLQNRKMPASKAVNEIAFSRTDKRETSNVNQKHAAVPKPASAEVTAPASVADCCNEIANESTEQILNALKSDEEKEDLSSSYNVLYGDPYEFSMVGMMQPEDCSYNTVIVSHSVDFVFMLRGSVSMHI